VQADPHPVAAPPPGCWPAGTSKRQVVVEVAPGRLAVKLDWHGRVVDGPLWRRVKAREALWLLDDGGRELQLMLPKDEPHYWKGLFQGERLGLGRGGGGWGLRACRRGLRTPPVQPAGDVVGWAVHGPAHVLGTWPSWHACWTGSRRDLWLLPRGPGPTAPSPQPPLPSRPAGGEERSYGELLREAVQADEPTARLVMSGRLSCVKPLVLGPPPAARCGQRGSWPRCIML
jgi:hypothetical protein